jgi:hypothetical protein
MGLDIQSLRLLMIARQMGASFDRVVTLGRQDLLMTPKQIVGACSSFGIAIDDEEANRIAFSNDRFSEPMLHKLGAQTADSLDASGFEGATILQDLNRPFPSELKEKFNLVFDGGTLEHVFDFPKALKSCMEMPVKGGHFVMASPSNNQMGHGFYQFSPELFYRVFSPENGYELKSLFLVPNFVEDSWYSVVDPREAKTRIGHNAGAIAYSLFGIAQRSDIVPMFVKPPQQSDYSAEWSHLPGKASDHSRLWFFDEITQRQVKDTGSLRSAVKKLAPKKLVQFRQALSLAMKSQKPPNPAYFRPVGIPPGSG